MPTKKKAVKKKAKKKTTKKTVKKKSKKTVKKTVKQQKLINQPSPDLQKQIKPIINIKQDIFLTTISMILKTLAFIILIIGALSSLFSWNFYSWWVGFLVFVLIWIIASSMRYW
jgi:sorbitol-specific phosphotransferase system component IIBC